MGQDRKDKANQNKAITPNRGDGLFAFQEERVVPGEIDPTARTTDEKAVVRCQPAGDTEVTDDARGEPIAEPDDREEAGYGYGV